MAQVLVVALVSLLLCEIGVRVVFAIRLNDKNVLLYPWQPRERARFGRVFRTLAPDKEMDGYLKYEPNPAKKIYVPSGDGDFVQAAMKINSRGFRGEEPLMPKPDDVVRVICLGESSTIGAFNRDHQTYPYQLEQALNEAAPEQRFEVLNFGVSESTSEALRELVLAEVLPMQPDVVTYYGAHNDVRNFLLGKPGVRLPEEHRALGGRVEGKSISLGFDLLRYLGSLSRLPDEVRGRTFEIVGPRYRENVEFVARTLQEEGVRFIYVTQKIKAVDEAYADRPYAEYYDAVRQRYEEGTLGNVFGQPVGMSHWHLKEALGSYMSKYNQYVALAHFQLVEAARGYAGGRFEVAEGIASLDGAADAFVSHVHLTEEGNHRLAGAIAGAILDRQQRPEDRTTPPSDRSIARR